MATARLLFISATLLVCAVAAVDVTPSPTVPPATTTTKGPAPKPTTSPTPSPPATAMYSYVNKTVVKNTTCMIRMNGVMDWNITYNTTKKTIGVVHEIVDGTAMVDNSRSSCVYRRSARLVLMWNGTNNETRQLTFNLKAGSAKRSMHWNLENVTLNFTVSKEVFPNYPKPDTRVKLVSKDFIDSSNDQVEYQRSYLCNASRMLTFKNATVFEDLNVNLNLTDFRIQAFEFKDPNSTKSAFGNARACPMDATGKKIVPIAVGIALGVLVIAVIIAFVISKVVNRKKSGYEALN